MCAVLVLHLLILWGLVVLALAVAFLAEHRRKKDGDKPEYAVALGFVASSYGLLLGLLVAFGANHYTDVRQKAQDEADSLLALYDTVNVYPQQIRNPTQHGVLCYMRAIRDDDWPSMERGSHLESPRALLIGDRLRVTIAGLPTKGAHEGSAYGRAQGIMTDADKSRQQLLFFTQSRVPAALWGVIYVGAFLLFLLIAMHYAGRPAGRIVALGSVVTLLTVVVAVLSSLDQPYGVGARVGPTSLSHAIALIDPNGARTGVYGPCSTATST
jgi:hypothetical protein